MKFRQSLIPLLLAVGVLAGCTSDEEKVRRVITQAVEECKNAEGDFHEVTVLTGKDEVLRVACEQPITDLELVDEFHAKATTGPYHWLVGVDTETGVWVLTQVGWEELEQARRARSDDAPKDALERAEKLLAEAQQELPESRWIRAERLENLLELREKSRAKADDSTSMGPEAEKVHREVIALAEEKDDPALAAEARVMVIDYYRDQKRKIEDSLSSVGSSDEWLESLIKQARKDNNKEDLENYTKELEERRAERPALIEQMETDITTLTRNVCQELGALSSTGIEQEELKQQIVAMKESIDCSPSAQGAGAQKDAEE